MAGRAAPRTAKSEREKAWVSVAVIGEARVGKTNLISKLTQDEYPGARAPKEPLDPIKFEGPLKAQQSAEHAAEVIKLKIHDTSSSDESIWDATDGLLHNVDVIVLAFDAKSKDEEAKSLAKCASLLERLRDTEGVCDKPVLLVGTKMDLRNGPGKTPEAAAQTDSRAPELMAKYASVEGCIQCSARTGQNVAEVFWFARRLHIYPVSPLYDIAKKELTEGCNYALRRIFRMCQKNREPGELKDVMTDEDLKGFQVTVFKQELSDQELAQVKQMVKDNAQQSGLGLANAFTNTHSEDLPQDMTLLGFHQMQKVFLQKGRTELVWQMLWEYGYDRELQLEVTAYNSAVETKPGDELQLSAVGCTQLKRWFLLHDENGDGYLDKNELQNFFGPMGANHPFATENDYTNSVVLCPVSNKGSLSLPGFMARWEFAVSTAPLQAMRWLAILGTNNPAEFVARVKRRRRDKRALLRCLLLDRDAVAPGGNKLMSNLDCGPITASTKKGGAKQAPERRVGVVLVPAEDPAGPAPGEEGEVAELDEEEKDELEAKGPFLAVIRCSDEASEAEQLKNSNFYDVISVVVNDMSAAQIAQRLRSIADAASELPIVPCTVGKVQPRRAGDGGGDPDEEYRTHADGAGAGAAVGNIPVLAYTGDKNGAKMWVCDAWGNAEQRRSGSGSGGWLGTLFFVTAAAAAIGMGLSYALWPKQTAGNAQPSQVVGAAATAVAATAAAAAASKSAD
eukprot:COSAG03_NODE_717_length_6119_cov_44.906645_2_plen_736_part_00